MVRVRIRVKVNWSKKTQLLFPSSSNGIGSVSIATPYQIRHTEIFILTFPSNPRSHSFPLGACSPNDIFPSPMTYSAIPTGYLHTHGHTMDIRWTYHVHLISSHNHSPVHLLLRPMTSTWPLVSVAALTTRTSQAIRLLVV